MGKLSFLVQAQRKWLGTTIPVINIHGPIMQEMSQKISKRLKQINVDRAVALAVSINSPGGLPVQSQIICKKLRKYSNDNNLKIYTFAQDVAASGGYFILSIGHQVYADRTSIIGSIGSVISKYHVEGLMQSYNLQHKHISSSNKKLLSSIMNPMSVSTEEQKAYLKQICNYSHSKFVQHVKNQRGKKLLIDDKIFSGQIYSGEQAAKNGLVDGVGSMIEVLQQKYPDAIVDVQKQPNPLKNFIRELI